MNTFKPGYREYEFVVFRWLTRIASLASIVVLLLFVFGGAESLQFRSLREVVGFAFFPVGILVGMLLGWKWHWVGGLFSLISLVAFYAWHFVDSGRFPSGPWFLIFTLPAIMFLIVGVLKWNQDDD